MFEAADAISTGTFGAQGARLAFRVDGPQDASAVVFANSLGLDLRTWQPQVTPLAARFRVIRYDGRSHGHSDPPALSQDLHAAIPQSQLVVFPDAAHLSNVEQPDAFTARVLGFLDSPRR